MQLKVWKNLFFWILLASSGGNFYCMRVDAAELANTDIILRHHKNDLAPNITSLDNTKIHQPCHKLEQEIINSFCKHSNESQNLYSEIPSNLTQQTPETAQTAPTENLGGSQEQDELPQLEVQPSNFPASSDSIEQILNAPEINESERLERLWQILQEQKPPPLESNSDRELGLRLRPRPLEQLPLPPTELPVAQFKPIGYLQGRVSYFQTSNIFSSNDLPIEDGFIFSGLTLASTYLPLGSKTYLNGSIDGNLIRYIDKSQYNNNQVRLNLSISQQLSQGMFGKVSWTNQQLFYATNGDRFLGENSLQLSLGRRDLLTSRLVLDSFYELSVNFANPESRNRVINSFWVSLNYYLQKPLQVGLDYQFNYSDFTQRQREDQFHRLFGHLNYQISDFINMNVQAGVTLGNSTAQNVDFNGWFFSLNYNLELGRF
ncbi:hypothetical protein [aff. Roholtiella sp. LEGE 12411]|uniref:hypothetical protein n=1 Tax=aff. Roholtiella sp. LEGE 12411 TaxID=1828822 RepID=UPI00188235CF|nr:hypothetical protein [aff. Roholtiella sp. LEGE 12411]MBE9037288.1 hypothetical protein [aff. Roholtiella sp. LEGE 12411]